MRRYHIQLDDGEAGAYALLPGDPGRCEAIAARLGGAERFQSFERAVARQSYFMPASTPLT